MLNIPLNIGDKWGVNWNLFFFPVFKSNSCWISELCLWKPTPYALRDSYKFLFLNFLCTPLPAPEYPDLESIMIFCKLIDFFFTNGISGKSIDVG